MIPNSTQIFGPPGCGKTEYLMRQIEKAIEAGVPPESIAFVSFSRKAIEEARDRAMKRFNLSAKQLVNFRTLHSTGFVGLGLRHEDVMSSVDYSELGKMLGEQFNVNVAPEDGVLIPQDLKSGSKYLRIIDRSRYRMVSLDEEWREHETFDVSLFKCKQVYEQMVEYKTKMGKCDYVDMIEMYPSVAEAPRLVLLIVDEAQDLTPLQWLMVQFMAQSADEVLIAGDDDQAIHRWTGVDVKQFIAMSPKQIVLNQSYRLPRKIFEVAQRIVSRIKDRVPKEYAPTDEEGVVKWHYDFHSIDMREGSWTVMARTNYLAEKVASSLYRDGYYYSIKGRNPITVEQARAIKTWRELKDGKGVELGRIIEFYETVPKQGDKAVVKRGSRKLLDAADPSSTLTLADLIREFGFISKSDLLDEDPRDAFDILGFGSEMRAYLIHLENSGEDITKPPRIKVSTIHAMKGGEDDNCVVFCATSAAATYTRFPDDEHRIFYVAVTRARKELHIIESFEKHRYQI
jgi:superfamily I DNA/RNA helicase